MKKIYKAMCLASLSCLPFGTVMAQEAVSAITPLKITSGLNADVIAEAKADDSNTTKTSGNFGWIKTAYQNNLATMVDNDGATGGRNAFFTTDVQEDGAIKYKTVDGQTYLDGNTDGVLYHIASATENNALLIADENASATLALSTLSNGELPAASTIYLLATSTDGTSTLTVDIIGADNTVLGTTTVNIGDWYLGNSSEKLTQIYETKRIVVKGVKHTAGLFSYNWNGDAKTEINYISGGEDGAFCIQRIAVSTLTSESIKEIRITKTNSDAQAVILAATAVTEAVTERDGQTDLTYLINTTTNQRIAETVKGEVNLLRDFKQDMWQPLVLNYQLTAAQAKKMFGDGISLSKITDESFNNTRITFSPVSLDDDDDIVIDRGEYYLIKLPVLGDVDTETGMQKYSCDFVQFLSPEDYSTGLSATKTISNQNGDGTTVTFHGTYVSGKNIGVGSYAVSGGQFIRYTDDPQIGAFRFWITLEGETEAKQLTLDADGNGTTSIAITNADNAANNASDAIYSIDGRLVKKTSASTEGLAKGIYIINNKKVLVK